MQYPHPHDPHSFPPPPPISGPPPPPHRRSSATRFFTTLGILAASAVGLAVVATFLFPDAVASAVGAALFAFGSRLLFGCVSFPGGDCP